MKNNQNKSVPRGKNGGKRPGAGRKPGVPNKVTALLKDAILEAATLAGGKSGLVGYLQKQAALTPASFLSLLGKVLPMQIEGTGKDGAIVVEIIKRTYGEDTASG